MVTIIYVPPWLDMRFFKDNHTFNSDIGFWDTSNVTVMSWMFSNARAFNQDISNWDVSKVICIICSIMLGLEQNIGNWDTSSVTDMFQMFKNATF